MLTGWCRSRQYRALARNLAGVSSPAAQPRAGFGASGSRKCASSAAAASGDRPSVSSHMIRPCCHDSVPAPSAARVSGRSVLSLADSSRKRAAAPSLTVSAHATSAVTDISSASRSETDASGAAKAAAAAAKPAAAWTFNAATLASSLAVPASTSSHASASSRNGSAAVKPPEPVTDTEPATAPAASWTKTASTATEDPMPFTVCTAAFASIPTA